MTASVAGRTGFAKRFAKPTTVRTYVRFYSMTPTRIKRCGTRISLKSNGFSLSRPRSYNSLMSTTTRAAAWLAAAAVVGASVVANANATAAHHHRALAVTGFQSEGSPNSRITASEKALTTVGVDGVSLSGDGASVAAPDAAARKALRVAHASHLRAEFVVSNWDNGINDFSETVANDLLRSQHNINAVAQELAGTATSQHWNGVNIDLEALRPRDGDGLVTFLGILRHDLPRHDSVSVDVSNRSTAAGFRNGGYDLRGIADAASRIILMAYDEHGPWEHHPGPVGALPWQRRGLATVLKVVPAKQVDLGQAGYGYAWRPHVTTTLSDKRARRLVRRHHATPHFDQRNGEWTAQLPDGSTLWWADARSYKLRATLARRHNLHGLAVWSLGLSDQIR